MLFQHDWCELQLDRARPMKQNCVVAQGLCYPRAIYYKNAYIVGMETFFFTASTCASDMHGFHQ